MKNRNILAGIFLLILGFTLLTSSCKKRKAFKEEDGQAGIDARNLQGENDAAINDANEVLGDIGLLSGEAGSSSKVSKVLGTICGLSVDTSLMFQGKLTLNYNGTVCDNRKREGKILLTILNYPLQKWKQAGCVLKVEYVNYKVTRASDGKSVLLNGIVNVTNESGGNWVDLLFLGKPAIIHKVDGSAVKVKFDNTNSNAEFNISRRYTYTWINSVLAVKGEGLGTNDGISNLENWGITRDGDAFTSQVVTPIIWNSTCGAGAPIQGELNIKVEDKDFTLNCLFAVDTEGNSVVVNPNECAYGWRVEWKRKNKTKELIFPYR